MSGSVPLMFKLIKLARDYSNVKIDPSEIYLGSDTDDFFIEHNRFLVFNKDAQQLKSKICKKKL